MASKIVSVLPRAIILRSTNMKLRPQQLMFGSAIQHRKFATEEMNKKSEAEPSENEKKLAGDVEALTKEVTTLKEKNEDLLDKYNKTLEDSENLRSKLTQQIQDARLFGIQGLCKDLLDIADTLGHAIKAVPLKEISDENPHLKELYESSSITQESLLQVFGKHGVQKIDPINQKFDPDLHEVSFEKEVEDTEPNTVVEVSKLGYKLHERCLRPAIVGVSKDI